MRATRRGEAAVSLVIALLVASLIFRDLLIETALLVVLMVVAAEAVWVRVATWRPESRYVLTREGEQGGGRKVILYPGEESVEQVSLAKNVGGTVELESRVNFLGIAPRSVRTTGMSRLELRFRTEYAGDYSGKEVGVTVAGPLGLFSSRSTIPFAQEYVVYPRVLRVAAATVRLLGKSEIGGTPIQTPGVGSEYYEMRGYQPGDDYRTINWKATAREGETTVVEHMREVGGSYMVVLDTRALGFAEIDRLATTFLSLANALAASGVSFGVLVHDGDRVVAASSGETPGDTLRVALSAALSSARLELSPELLELVQLNSPKARARLLGGDQVSVLSQLPRLRQEQARGDVGASPWSTVLAQVRDRSARNVVWVSGLVGEIEPLVELAWQARHYRGSEFAVLDPCVDGAGGSREGRRLESLSRALSSAGAEFHYGEPLGVTQKILLVR